MYMCIAMAFLLNVVGINRRTEVRYRQNRLSLQMVKKIILLAEN